MSCDCQLIIKENDDDDDEQSSLSASNVQKLTPAVLSYVISSA